MKQSDRMNSASNTWEADPWDASDAVANSQLAGFQCRAEKHIAWSSIRHAVSPVFGTDREKLIGADVEFIATHDGEEMLLMRLAWHGFPDPPEWRLATRPCGQKEQPWSTWGYFADLPEAWSLPDIE